MARVAWPRATRVCLCVLTEDESLSRSRSRIPACGLLRSFVRRKGVEGGGCCGGGGFWRAGLSVLSGCGTCGTSWTGSQGSVSVRGCRVLGAALDGTVAAHRDDRGGGEAREGRRVRRSANKCGGAEEDRGGGAGSGATRGSAKQTEHQHCGVGRRNAARLILQSDSEGRGTGILSTMPPHSVPPRDRACTAAVAQCDVCSWRMDAKAKGAVKQRSGPSLRHIRITVHDRAQKETDNQKRMDTKQRRHDRADTTVGNRLRLAVCPLQACTGDDDADPCPSLCLSACSGAIGSAVRLHCVLSTPARPTSLPDRFSAARVLCSRRSLPVSLS